MSALARLRLCLSTPYFTPAAEICANIRDCLLLDMSWAHPPRRACSCAPPASNRTSSLSDKYFKKWPSQARNNYQRHNNDLRKKRVSPGYQVSTKNNKESATMADFLTLWRALADLNRRLERDKKQEAAAWVSYCHF